ncbi:hypothetical protein [Actinosynnema sp. NPDC023587]|uniref:hypothetical protein n=1 Tax=Actinosynnema sp. NPDC023587 TaxID=3154695 RepID=UPI0033FDDDF7
MAGEAARRTVEESRTGRKQLADELRVPTGAPAAANGIRVFAAAGRHPVSRAG